MGFNTSTFGFQTPDRDEANDPPLWYKKLAQHAEDVVTPTTYSSLAALQAVSGDFVGQRALVSGSTAAENGEYRWSGAGWELWNAGPRLAALEDGTSDTITLASGYSSLDGETTTLYRLGRLRVLTLQASGSIPTGTTTDLAASGAIPSADRPAANKRGAGATTGGRPVIITVTNAGGIQVSNWSGTAGTYASGVVVWVV